MSLGNISYSTESDSRFEGSPTSTSAPLDQEHLIQAGSVYNNGKTSNIRTEKNIGTSSRTEKELFNILNSQPQPVDKDQHDQDRRDLRHPPANITDEDLAFLKAANEIVKLNENKIDPTIRDIFSRLQYSNSPHGGMPISQDYLKTIDMKTPTTNFTAPIDNEAIQEDVHHQVANLHTDFRSTVVTPQATQDVDLRNRMSLLSTDDMYTAEMMQKSPSNLFIPPFTENPLRNPPNNLDFPQFSLDIFKSPEEIHPAMSPTASSNIQLQSILAHNLTANLLAQHNQQQHRTPINTPQSMNTVLGYAQGQDTYYTSGNGEGEDVEDDEMLDVAGSDSSGNEGREGEVDDEDDSGEDDSDSDELHNDKGYASKIDRRRGSASARFANNSDDGTPRNYKCKDCGMGFKRSSDLKRHEKIHLKVPPNICPLCRKGFARRDALKRHVNTLTCKRNRQRLLKELAGRGETL